MAANTNWYNAHNFYGELERPRRGHARDVRQFFKTFYAPNNAVLVVTGDFDAHGREGVDREVLRRHPIARRCRRRPICAEPRQTAEKRTGRVDPLANRPALGLGYHLPERNTPQWYAFGLLDQILAQGLGLAAL